MLAVLTLSDHEMLRYIKDFWWALAMTAVLCAPPCGVAGESAESAQAKAKLAAVRERISAVTNRLGAELKQRDALGARLREADLGITAERRRLEGLHASVVAAERRRAEVRAEQTRVGRALDAERAALASQVRAAYLAGQQERIRLLLMQNDPAAAGRMSEYYAYLARDRSQRIAQIDARLAELQGLAAQSERISAQLQELQGETARNVAELQKARDERASALAAVTQQVASGNQELAQLKREEQAEEALVADLAQVLQDLPVDSQQSFDALRGRLPWPVPGRVTTRFQDVGANASSGLRRNGVLIEAAPGAKVRAPYFGRVIYADWLQGLGLLMIIGHSGNYMTLYGHAEVLYKSVGDWVAPGDVIAALSDSGGSGPQLYFEIREGRTAKDPKLWLKAKP
jgi:septal ring factor EnvC (AmiA/AmiB activator)